MMAADETMLIKFDGDLEEPVVDFLDETSNSPSRILDMFDPLNKANQVPGDVSSPPKASDTGSKAFPLPVLSTPQLVAKTSRLRCIVEQLSECLNDTPWHIESDEAESGINELLELFEFKLLEKLTATPSAQNQSGQSVKHMPFRNFFTPDKRSAPVKETTCVQPTRLISILEEAEDSESCDDDDVFNNSKPKVSNSNPPLEKQSHDGSTQTDESLLADGVGGKGQLEALRSRHAREKCEMEEQFNLFVQQEKNLKEQLLREKELTEELREKLGRCEEKLVEYERGLPNVASIKLENISMNSIATSPVGTREERFTETSFVCLECRDLQRKVQEQAEVIEAHSKVEKDKENLLPKHSLEHLKSRIPNDKPLSLLGSGSNKGKFLMKCSGLSSKSTSDGFTKQLASYINANKSDIALQIESLDHKPRTIKPSRRSDPKELFTNHDCTPTPSSFGARAKKRMSSGGSPMVLPDELVDGIRSQCKTAQESYLVKKKGCDELQKLNMKKQEEIDAKNISREIEQSQNHFSASRQDTQTVKYSGKPEELK